MLWESFCDIFEKNITVLDKLSNINFSHVLNGGDMTNKINKKAIIFTVYVLEKSIICSNYSIPAKFKNIENN